MNDYPDKVLKKEILKKRCEECLNKFIKKKHRALVILINKRFEERRVKITLGGYLHV